jgi:hypothetical protein
MVASVTDSPSVGTRISVMALLSPNALCGDIPLLSSPAKAEDPVIRDGCYRKNGAGYWMRSAFAGRMTD